MRAYLTKEEYVAGAHGIETRYPLLDKALVQEFLWLSPHLKNRRHKAPIVEYLERNRFPFHEGLKVGFCAHLNLRREASDPRLQSLFSWNPLGAAGTKTWSIVSRHPPAGRSHVSGAAGADPTALPGRPRR
jgi:hypothetical protein